MEPISMFAASIGIIATCRLTFAAVESFGKGIYSKGSSPAKRDDWYCFFKTSDLLGSGSEQDHSSTLTERESLEQRRRMQQRPRLQA